MRGRALLLGLGAAWAAGCATTTTKTAVERLQEAVEGYNHAFRWKNYERSALYLPNDKRTAFLAAYEDDESSLQVEDYTIRQLDMLSDKAAKVAIKVSYLLLPSVNVKQATLVQHWAEVNGNWVLEAEDNSIRELDPAKQPRDPRARAKPADPEPGVNQGQTTVDVERPDDPLPEDNEGDPDEPR